MDTRTLAPSHVTLLSALLLAPLACADDVAPEAAPDAEVELRDGDAATIRSELELLRDGLTAVADDPELAALAHEQILAAAETGEFEVTLAKLVAAAAELDLDLGAAVQAGVLARGGSDEEAAHAAAILTGFTAEGITAAPTLYVPQLDLDYFGLDAWQTPALLSTIASTEGDLVAAIEAGGPELLVDEGALVSAPTWFLAYTPGDDDTPSPLRFWARCYCVQTNPQGGTVGVTCATGGSATTLGRCGRTGLFGNNCNGVCQSGASGT